MRKTEVISFRCEPVVRDKLFAMSVGMGTSAANVIKQLIEEAPVDPVQVPGLTLVQKENRVAATNFTSQSSNTVSA